MFLAVSNPPALPAFLASKYDLKPIISPPTDNQLKSIHGAIRAAKDASKLGELFPELNCSINLVPDLEDYLFDAQMARYRSTHGFILSPKDLVYRPPTLPDHITNTVTLQSITGPPSDAELKLVALANRTCEGFSNSQYHLLGQIIELT
ncbi:laminin domain protein [Ceratobasidium sp. AG-Ba]|nr:laminin domain protein [Ceratobasidium sp. AG-Ba]